MTEPDTPAPAANRPASRPWWRDAVIYQVYVRSFADSDGDGVGDLPGIRHRLAHLQDLGVDAVWVTPFYPSPMADGGYDVADYCDVEPLFGTLADFDALVADAHARGLRVIVDIVPNHTSTAHRWFQEALRAGPGSRARARYVFRPGRGAHGEDPPNDWVSVFGGPAWTRVREADGRPGEWYLHLFAPQQPDLDWDNPEVRADFEAVLRFWLDRGVDGFRIDVAHGLVKDPALPDLGPDREGVLEPPRRANHPHWDRDGVHDVWRGWRKVLDGYPGERMLVAEAWVLGRPRRLAEYVRSDELHTAFNFDFLKCPWDATALREVIDACLQANDEVGAPTTWVIGNHDVTRPVTRYGGGEVGVRRARAAALLMLALPGGAYVYQGEELGLPEVEDLPAHLLQDPVWERSGHTERGRDGCRVPMPWSGAEPPFGFGPPGSSASWLPAPPAWRDLTVAAQRGRPGSTLELYRAALRLRREHPALGEGSLRWLPAPPGVLLLARDPGFVAAVNLGAEPVDLPVHGELLLASGPLPAGSPLRLPGDTAVWLQASR